MKSFAKLLLVGTVAVMAIAVSAAPSEAAKEEEHPGRVEFGQLQGRRHVRHELRGQDVFGERLRARRHLGAGDLHAGLRQGAVPAEVLIRSPRLLGAHRRDSRRLRASPV